MRLYSKLYICSISNMCNFLVNTSNLSLFMKKSNFNSTFSVCSAFCGNTPFPRWPHRRISAVGRSGNLSRQFIKEMAHRGRNHADIKPGRGESLAKGVEQVPDNGLLPGCKAIRDGMNHPHRAGKAPDNKRHGLHGRERDILRINPDIAEGAFIQGQHLERNRRGHGLPLEVQTQHLRGSHGHRLLKRITLQQVSITFRDAEVLLHHVVLHLAPDLAKRIQVNKALGRVVQNPVAHGKVTVCDLAKPYLTTGRGDNLPAIRIYPRSQQAVLRGARHWPALPLSIHVVPLSSVVSTPDCVRYTVFCAFSEINILRLCPTK